jgi:transposase
MESRVMMTQKQLNRYVVIERSLEGGISVKEAAEVLNLSIRQVIRLRNGVKEQGASALIHKNQGRPPAHALPEELKKKIIELKSSDNYKDANFKHYQDLLEKNEGIKVSYAYIYLLLTKAGFKSPKKRRRTKTHHRRKRKAQEGLLVQIDSSPFEWFGGSKKYSLHGSIDDATGKVFGLFMTENECLQGYFEVTRQMVNNHGIAVSFYSDQHAIFVSPLKGKLSIEEQLQGKVVNDTQFGRAMRELGINMIYANSPQAKGRIERLWETLQSRLPVELKIAGIDNPKQANHFFQKEYITLFNEQFAVEAAEAEIAFRPQGNIDLNSILCVKEKRKVDSGGVFSFHGKHFQLVTEKNQLPVSTRAQITVCISNINGIWVEYKGNIYQTVPFIKPKKTKKRESKEPNNYKPPETHYFKKGKELAPKISFEESNQEILDMLAEVFLGKQENLI